MGLEYLSLPRHIIEMPSEQVQTELWRPDGRGGAAEPAVREDALRPCPRHFDLSVLRPNVVCGGTAAPGCLHSLRRITEQGAGSPATTVGAQSSGLLLFSVLEH